MSYRDECIQAMAQAIDACGPDGVSHDWEWWRNEATAALDALLAKLEADSRDYDKFEEIGETGANEYHEACAAAVSVARARNDRYAAEGKERIAHEIAFPCDWIDRVFRAMLSVLKPNEATS